MYIYSINVIIVMYIIGIIITFIVFFFIIFFAQSLALDVLTLIQCSFLFTAHYYPLLIIIIIIIYCH